MAKQATNDSFLLTKISDSCSLTTDAIYIWNYLQNNYLRELSEIINLQLLK